MSALPRDYDEWRLSGLDEYTDGGFDDAEAERLAQEYAEERGDWLLERKRDRELDE